MAAEFSISRTARLHASAATLFAQIEDFRTWSAWFPWDRMHPTMYREYSGAERGVGARYAWSGAGRAGTGSMEIVDASAGRQVVVHLRVVEPIRASATLVFILVTLGPGTTDVTCAVDARLGLLTLLAARRVSVKTVIDRQLEEGLVALEQAARSATGSARP